MTNVFKLPLEMPPALARQVRILSLPPDPGFQMKIEPEHHPAASEWLRRKRDLIEPASREDCHEWLVMLCFGINGVEETSFKLREEAIWEMCGDLPALVWCKETRNAMRAHTPFLPAPGECREVLVTYFGPLLREIEVLERVANTPPPRPYVPPPERPPVTDEAKSHVSQVVAEFARERSPESPGLPAAERRPRAGALSNRVLLAIYEKAAAPGNLAAQTRVGVLRARLAETTAAAGKTAAPLPDPG